MKQSEFKKVNETIAGEVTKGYKAIETGVVGGYKKIEDGVVSGYKKMEESEMCIRDRPGTIRNLP